VERRTTEAATKDQSESRVAHFIERKREKPAMWNGRVLLMHDHTVHAGVLRGGFFETDFASFLAWRDWGYPSAGAIDCFACAALLASDGAFLLGVMGGHTANAHRIYFPCGTPDRNDLVDSRVDLDGSIRRELKEETGLDIGEFDVVPGWHAVMADPLLALVKLVRSPLPGEQLRAGILAHFATENQPELADIRIVRGPADLDPMMPSYVLAALRHFWVLS
jgi:8-oxo-dGTP pyrophosphatase MutT (NUDIX family)